MAASLPSGTEPPTLSLRAQIHFQNKTGQQLGRNPAAAAAAARSRHGTSSGAHRPSGSHAVRDATASCSFASSPHCKHPGTSTLPPAWRLAHAAALCCAAQAWLARWCRSRDKWRTGGERGHPRPVARALPRWFALTIAAACDRAPQRMVRRTSARRRLRSSAPNGRKSSCSSRVPRWARAMSRRMSSRCAGSFWARSCATAVRPFSSGQSIPTSLLTTTMS